MKANNAVREYLSQIGKKGGETVTAKKLAHLSTIQSKGGQTVTPKKLESLARARAARAAKAKSG